VLQATRVFRLVFPYSQLAQAFRLQHLPPRPTRRPIYLCKVPRLAQDRHTLGAVANSPTSTAFPARLSPGTAVAHSCPTPHGLHVPRSASEAGFTRARRWPGLRAPPIEQCPYDGLRVTAEMKGCVRRDGEAALEGRGR
jgi:hypothetical protein